jgi:hypothetical protein
MTEAPKPRTLAAPPYRDYLTEGVSRVEALAMCEEVAAETPEMAPRYLRWLVDEVRASGWSDGAQPAARVAEPGRQTGQWSRVIVMPIYEDRGRDETIAGWRALWEGEADPTQPLGEFEGPREEAMTWARNCRPTEILVFDPETRDLRPAE